MKRRPLWTPQDEAENMQIKVSTVYNWVYEGFIPYISITGRVLRFEPDAIDAWLEKMRKPGRSRRVPRIDLETGDWID